MENLSTAATALHVRPAVACVSLNPCDAMMLLVASVMLDPNPMCGS